MLSAMTWYHTRWIKQGLVPLYTASYLQPFMFLSGIFLANTIINTLWINCVEHTSLHCRWKMLCFIWFKSCDKTHHIHSFNQSIIVANKMFIIQICHSRHFSKCKCSLRYFSQALLPLLISCFIHSFITFLLMSANSFSVFTHQAFMFIAAVTIHWKY